MDEFSRIISADDHVVEPARVWQDRLPKKYLDVGPRIVRQGISNPRHIEGNSSSTRIQTGSPLTGGCTKTFAGRSTSLSR